MSQSLESIFGLLQTALDNGKPVKLATADKKRCTGIITAIVPGLVAPYQDRATVVVQTQKGIRRFQGYMITKVAVA